MPIGLISVIFTTIVILLIFIFNNKTKKLFSSYWFYSIFSLIFLIYFFTFRWLRDIISWIEQDYRGILHGEEVIISKSLLLDMCPFNSVMISLFLIFDRKRNFVQSLSFVGIFGAGITLYGGILFEGINVVNSSWLNNVSDVNHWWEYIFLNDLYFMMHFQLFIISFIVLLNSNAFDWIRILTSHIYAIVFFVYITIISFTLNITWNVTGIRPNDWGPFGEYSIIGSWFPNMPWPLMPIIMFGFVWIMILNAIILRNVMVLDERYIPKNMPYPKKIKEFYIDKVNFLKSNYNNKI